MDGWDSYDEGFDDIDTVESFEDNYTEPLDADVSSTMDSIESMEESIEHSAEDISFSEPEYVESVMDSVEADDILFDEEPQTEALDNEGDILTPDGDLAMDVPNELVDGGSQENIEYFDSSETMDDTVSSEILVESSIDNLQENYIDPTLEVTEEDQEIETFYEVESAQLENEQKLELPPEITETVEPVEVETVEETTEEVASIDVSNEVDSSMDQTEIIQETNDDTVQNSIEEIDDSSQVEEMIENGNEMDYENIQESIDSGEKVLTRDQTEQWELGNKAIEDTIEAMRDDLRDKGIEDGDRMEELVGHERTLLQEELAHNIEGDTSYHYDKPAWQEDPSILEQDDTNSEGPIEWNEGEAITIGHLDNNIEGLSDNETSIDAPSTVDGVMDSVSAETLEFEQDVSNEGIDESAEIRPIDEVGTWLEEVNPNFDPFDIESPYCNNCGSCAYAVYQRLEGNSEICATAENIGYNSEMEALTGMEQVAMSPEEIQSRLLEAGDGAHAIIGIDRSEGPGHWFNAANIDGKVVAIDGQTGEINDWPPDYGDVVNWEMSVKKEEL